jgi:hypothetical protein
MAAEKGGRRVSGGCAPARRRASVGAARPPCASDRRARPPPPPENTVRGEGGCGRGLERTWSLGLRLRFRLLLRYPGSLGLRGAKSGAVLRLKPAQTRSDLSIPLLPSLAPRLLRLAPAADVAESLSLLSNVVLRSNSRAAHPVADVACGVGGWGGWGGMGGRTCVRACVRAGGRVGGRA